jgi:hypothetical protein
MFFIKTKSARGHRIADNILRSMHMHPTSKVSKYCIGMAALGQVSQHKRFLLALRRVHLIADPQAAKQRLAMPGPSPIMDKVKLPAWGRLGSRSHKRLTTTLSALIKGYTVVMMALTFSGVTRQRAKIDSEYPSCASGG